MKGTDIQAAIDADPNAEFAVKPSRHQMSFRKIRGLAPLGPGAWSFREEQISTGRWVAPARPVRIRSSKLWPVQTAERVLDARAKNQGKEAERRAERVVSAERCAKMLRDNGVKSFVNIHGNVEVWEPAKLADLLLRSEASL